MSPKTLVLEANHPGPLGVLVLGHSKEISFHVLILTIFHLGLLVPSNVPGTILLKRSPFSL